MRKPKTERPAKPVRKGKKRRLPRFGKEVLLLVFALFVVATWRVVVHEMLHVKTPKSVLTAEWQRYSPGGSQLSVMLPAAPQAQSAEIPASEAATIKRAARYDFSVEQFKVALWDVAYVEGVPTDIERAASGAAEALSQSAGVTDYKDTKALIARSGRKGELVTGTFKRDGERMVLQAARFGDGPKLWQVIITHPASDRNGSIAARRILDSIEIKEP